MNPTEQRVAMLRYLQPLENGSLNGINPNDPNDGPAFWQEYVRQELLAAGATGAVARNYRWEGGSYKEIWEKFGGIVQDLRTEREKAIEELTAAFAGRAPTEEEIESLLNRRAQREPSHFEAYDDDVRESAKKSLTSQDVRGMIREVLRSRGILNEGPH
jgi:hypothetical protein